MCGVSANKQDKELQVDVLDLSDKNREALVSIFDDLTEILSAVPPQKIKIQCSHDLFKIMLFSRL